MTSQDIPCKLITYWYFQDKHNMLKRAQHSLSKNKRFSFLLTYSLTHLLVAWATLCPSRSLRWRA